ncbi:hypothetical protein BX600DRAFT_69103 [Xylariales sp. PMI_506]|nr:hypothetical protein BX600DRAFT_69103 [Xylariales sp. PMI_506]
MTPNLTKQWKVVRPDRGFDGLVFEEVSLPRLGENEVLLKIHAASLNYRDVAIPQGKYPSRTKFPIVGGSDGAGVVEEVGSKVTLWKAGDKVMTLFRQKYYSGDITPEAIQTSLGSVLDGVFRQYAIFDEQGLVRQPKNLSHEESSALPCAAATSWNALYGLKPLKPGQTVLVQGTGGVSIFALQFAKAAGATVIATTSSNAKIETLKKLGADHVINYKDDPSWGKTAKRLSPGGEGVDHVIEVGGAATMGQSFDAVKLEGIISIIGFLSGAKPEVNILDCLTRVFTVRGIVVGSKAMMEDMVEAIEGSDIHPVLDKRVSKLEQTREAYEYLWNGSHFGKVVVQIA